MSILIRKFIVILKLTKNQSKKEVQMPRMQYKYEE